MRASAAHPDGNAVLTSFEVEARSLRDPAQTKTLAFRWCWADHEQADGDYRLANVLDADRAVGWAVEGYERNDPRVALFLSEEPFGFEGGTELVVKLGYDSIYMQHIFGRERVSVASFDESALARLPLFGSGWYAVGPFPADGPQRDLRHRLRTRGRRAARPQAQLRRGQPVLDLLAGVRRRAAERARGGHQRELRRQALLRAQRAARRGLGGQRRRPARLPERQGGLRSRDRPQPGRRPGQAGLRRAGGREHAGPEGRQHRRACGLLLAHAARRRRAASGPAAGAAARGFARRRARDAHRARLEARILPGYRALTGEIAALEKRVAEIDARVPRTMVMKELGEPRPTYVLKRGQYDQPDKSRPVGRAHPARAGQAARGRAREPTRSRAVARRAGEPARRARGGQPPLGSLLRNGTRAHQRGFRPAGRVAQPPRAARLRWRSSSARAAGTSRACCGAS